MTDHELTDIYQEQEALNEALTPYANQIFEWSKTLKVQLLHHLNFDGKR